MAVAPDTCADPFTAVRTRESRLSHFIVAFSTAEMSAVAKLRLDMAIDRELSALTAITSSNDRVVGGYEDGMICVWKCIPTKFHQSNLENEFGDEKHRSAVTDLRQILFNLLSVYSAAKH